MPIDHQFGLWRSLWGLGVIAISLCSSAVAQHAEVISGEAILYRNKQSFTVRRGSRLIEGDQIAIEQQIQFLGDFGSFVASQRKGIIEFTLLRREGGCSRTFIAYLGKLRLTPRPFTCPRSILQVLSLASGGSYTFKGTDAFLSDDGKKRSTILVTKGLIASQSAGVTVFVRAGFANRITEGLPPESPIAIEPPWIDKIQFARLPWGIKIKLNTSPLNAVIVQGASVADGFGSREAQLNYPILGNDLTVTVINPLGLMRTYSYPLPTRK